jgi:hypothetical protein
MLDDDILWFELPDKRLTVCRYAIPRRVLLPHF